jgi:hypothetical protein
MIFDRGSQVMWSWRTNERTAWHSFWMSNTGRMDFQVSSTELRGWGSVGAVGWDAAWAHVLCGRGGIVGSWRAGKWAGLNWNAGVVGFGKCVCRWCKKLSCCSYDEQSVKLAGRALPQLTLFGGVPMDFLDCRVAFGWSHLTPFGDSPQKLDEWPKDCHLKHWRTDLVFLFFSHLMMQWYTFLICGISSMSVLGWKVTTNTVYLVINVCVVLFAFVIWEVFKIRNSCAVSSACISSTETLGGMPVRTTRGWMASGSGYEW